MCARVCAHILYYSLRVHALRNVVVHPLCKCVCPHKCILYTSVLHCPPLLFHRLSFLSGEVSLSIERVERCVCGAEYKAGGKKEKKSWERTQRD